MKKYTVILEIEVAENVIKDGLRLTNPNTQKAIETSIERDLFRYDNVTDYKIQVTKVIQPTFTLGELDELGMI